MLLASVGAAVSGATTGIAVQPSQPSVYIFDIPATTSHGGGVLMINLVEHSFVFDGQGEPGRMYYLQYTLAGAQGVHEFASVAASHSGNIHKEGVWLRTFGTWAAKHANPQSVRTLAFADSTSSDTEPGTLTAEPTFALSTTTPLYAELHYYPASSDEWTHDGTVTIVPVAFGAPGSTGPIVTYHCTFRTAYGGNAYANPVYDGPNIHLTDDYLQPYSNDVNVRTDNNYAYGDLYVYDSAGNSAYDCVDLNHDISG